MKKYQSHKIVSADKITAFEEAEGGVTLIHLQSGEKVGRSSGWIRKHDPQTGWYYVIYNEGTLDEYHSCSPAYIFESGYALVKKKKTKRKNR